MARTRVILTARDIMTRSLITLSPESSIFDAMSTLMTKRISGAPVVDDSGLLIGVLSELDCLRLLSSDDFYADEQEGGGCVRDFMTSLASHNRASSRPLRHCPLFPDDFRTTPSCGGRRATSGPGQPPGRAPWD